MMKRKKIYCCGCEKTVKAKLITGKEAYPTEERLHDLPFWQCVTCKNHVGCHHKLSNRIVPLGCIPTRQIRKARIIIHEIMDPLWKCGLIKRDDIYELMSDRLGYDFHVAEIKTIKEAKKIINELKLIREGIGI